MYQIEQKNLPKSEVELTGELPAEAFESAWQEVARKESARANIPGFRPGKIPEEMLVSRIGPHHLLQEAAEAALQKAYPEIIRERQLEVIGQPKVSITKLARGNALGFKIVAAILPDVILPDYKTVAKEVFSKKEDVTVTDKDVADALEHLRASRRKKREDGVEDPLPELNDTFAKTVGNFTTLEELQQTVRNNLRFEKELARREELRTRALASIADKTKMDIPQALADAERDNMMAQLKSQLARIGLSWEQYLSQIKKNEEDLRREWEGEGEKRARYGLVLRALIKAEHISPTDQELEDTISEIRKQRGEKANVDEARIREYAYSIITNEKVFKVLEGTALSNT